MAPRFLASLLAAAALTAGAAARADTYVIVNAGSAVQTMSQKQVVDVFMGRFRVLPSGESAQAFDLPRDSDVRASFYRSATGLEPAQVNSFWARLLFTGQTAPPLPVTNEAAVIDMVKRQPGAIGYVSSEPTDKGVRVVLVLKETRSRATASEL